MTAFDPNGENPQVPTSKTPAIIFILIIIICTILAVVVSITGLAAGNAIVKLVSPRSSSPPVYSSGIPNHAVYSIGGANYTGHIVFFEDGTGFGEINGTRSGEFTWETTSGIHFDDTVRGKIRYWGCEISTILFPGNLTMISPEVPGTYAVLVSRGGS